MSKTANVNPLPFVHTMQVILKITRYYKFQINMSYHHPHSTGSFDNIYQHYIHMQYRKSSELLMWKDHYPKKFQILNK